MVLAWLALLLKMRRNLIAVHSDNHTRRRAKRESTQLVSYKTRSGLDFKTAGRARE